MNEVGFTHEPSKPPFCLVCNKTVDKWGYEQVYETVLGIDGRRYYTGITSIRLWVMCHGEQWSGSYRGVL